MRMGGTIFRDSRDAAVNLCVPHTTFHTGVRLKRDVDVYDVQPRPMRHR